MYMYSTWYSQQLLFCRTSLQLVHRLVGHEYGGQAVLILEDILYSGAKV
jgi:hypothetical protein